ncbi:hypothetical protein BDK51DRAFT_31400 [Blyttiomyces helicus]|uniref:Uncharacterized protein n=1 Tax=Blyttiomyces helicus TaxID=388810 RepID=A0A4P9WHU7_9FUNG|nr:hypothetical protein BDK51DRAFT_31400 [Blyttiomyces helicus]|eukprot:RKO92411.1 hypothetical protein BDK51DRAFT_31400 [Blyttiomyces helicus]
MATAGSAAYSLMFAAQFTASRSLNSRMHVNSETGSTLDEADRFCTLTVQWTRTTWVQGRTPCSLTERKCKCPLFPCMRSVPSASFPLQSAMVFPVDCGSPNHHLGSSVPIPLLVEYKAAASTMRPAAALPRDAKAGKDLVLADSSSAISCGPRWNEGGHLFVLALSVEGATIGIPYPFQQARVFTGAEATAVESDRNFGKMVEPIIGALTDPLDGLEYIATVKMKEKLLGTIQIIEEEAYKKGAEELVKSDGAPEADGGLPCPDAEGVGESDTILAAKNEPPVPDETHIGNKD